MTELNGDPFDAVAAAWRELMARRTEEGDAAWRSAISGLRARYVELRRTGRWVKGPADFFGVAGLTYSELHHSAMLAWLLDPEGRHGLGRRLLDAVGTSCFGEDWPPFRVMRVEREVTSAETRADIVVWGDRLTMVIENKVLAGEGDRQCDRLYERFVAQPDARFIFLSPSGCLPRTATGPARAAFRPLSYRTLAELLSQCLDEEGDTFGDGRHVAVDYVATIRRELV